MKMPTLFDFGEGVLRTHVTWEDLQADCLEIFGNNAIFGPNKKATSIGDGRGFLSKMCLIDPDWRVITEAPNQFVVKISSRIITLEANEKMKGQSAELDSIMKTMSGKMQDTLSESIRRIHDTEVDVYDLIKKYKITGIPVPKIFKAVKFSDDCPHKGYLIMEYIENTINLSIYDNVEVDDVKQVLRAMASLEAASLNFTEKEKNSLSCSSFKQFYASSVNPALRSAKLKLLRQISTEKLIPKIDKLDDILPEILQLSQFDMAHELGMTPVLVHADLWSANMLWKKTDNSAVHLSAIVDFQRAHFGHPAVDFIRIVTTALSGKDRRENWDMLIEFFYKELLDNLGTHPAPYTIEQLKENIRRFFPMAGALLVPVLGQLFQVNQATLDEKRRKETIELIMEKAECFMDDIFYHHERNEKLRNHVNGKH